MVDRSSQGTARRRLPRTLLVGTIVVACAASAGAQDLTHRFINPSFGGNPFYSDHLLATATIHRPASPTPTASATPTQEELLAQQIRARLLAQLQGDILDQIQNAAVGASGSFDVGTQRISFTRTATETRVTFLNTETNETQTVVLPVIPAASSASGADTASVAAAVTQAQRQLAAQSTTQAAAPADQRRAAIAAATAQRSAEQSLLASGNPAAPGGSVLPPF